MPVNSTSYPDVHLKARHPQLDEYKIVQFHPTPAMSTYLLAFAITDFTFRSSKGPNGLPVRVYAPDFELDSTALAAKVVPEVVGYFNEMFGVAYALPKLDILMIPDMKAGRSLCLSVLSFQAVSLIVLHFVVDL